MKKLFTILVVLGCAVLMSTPAMAVCVDDADTFCLDNPNQVGAAAIVVQVDLNGDELTVTIADDAGLSGIKIFQVGIYNVSNGVVFLNGPTGWTVGAASCCDGFDAGGGIGTLSSHTGNPGGDSSSSITFDLSGVPTFGDGGAVFAVHLGGFGEGCSLWLTNNSNFVATDPAAEGCGGTEIPEPGSLALLGTGLFSAVGVIRRKLKKA